METIYDRHEPGIDEAFSTDRPWPFENETEEQEASKYIDKLRFMWLNKRVTRLEKALKTEETKASAAEVA